MPPKRKAAAAKKGAGGKKAKPAEEEHHPSLTEAIQKLKSQGKGKTRTCKPDQYFPYAAGSKVLSDYDCMLNQTNIGHNNNKYYVIQVLSYGASFYAWNRWGRVGEPGATALKGPFSTDAPAIKDFEKKFKDKTKNNWDKRDSFTPSPGKYTLIEMSDDTDVVDAPMTSVDMKGKTVGKCSLNTSTQSLVKLIFDNDMFRDAMEKFDIDVKKMPLGQISKSQIAKGFECLEELEKDVNANKKTNINALSSKFYTLIPHNFGRRVPPPLNTAELVQEKMNMLAVLGDIEIAQSLQKDKDAATAKCKADEVPHPLDVSYGLLNCGLKHVAHTSSEFKTINTYLDNTKGWHSSLKLLDVWDVNRDGEGSRFKVHDKLANRKLLWHGTSVAVVAAILKSGLRIMPHSGGRVGRGIYFASENGKSAGYVGCAGKIGIMFLNEVALGKEKEILRDNSSLVAAPSGYDSVLAKGQTEPDPKKNATFTMDGKTVTVPIGKPISQGISSSFGQSEYLVYKESQCRIRYLLKINF